MSDEAGVEGGGCVEGEAAGDSPHEGAFSLKSDSRAGLEGRLQLPYFSVINLHSHNREYWSQEL